VKLILDIGNTRIKWRMDGALGDVTHLQDGWEAQLLAGWHGVERPTAVFAGSVASESISQRVAECVSQCWPGQTLLWLRSQAHCCGVQIQYAEPQRFGIDRFAALVAARMEFMDQALIVVDAGTAITVDALDVDGLHQGGMIMPGVRLLGASLSDAASQIPKIAVAVDDAVCTPQHETRLAVSAGIRCMVQGGVEHAIEQALAVLGGAASIVVTGGDQAVQGFAMFESRGLSVYRREALVMDGLERMSYEVRDGSCPCH
jgi:type III pantothenate kinase